MEDDPLAVGRPILITDQGPSEGRQLEGIRAVSIRNPDFLATGPRGVESDFFPVRRILGPVVMARRGNKKPWAGGLTSRWRDFGAPDVKITGASRVDEMAAQADLTDGAFYWCESFRFAAARNSDHPQFSLFAQYLIYCGCDV